MPVTNGSFASATVSAPYAAKDARMLKITESKADTKKAPKSMFYIGVVSFRIYEATLDLTTDHTCYNNTHFAVDRASEPIARRKRLIGRKLTPCFLQDAQLVSQHFAGSLFSLVRSLRNLLGKLRSGRQHGHLGVITHFQPRERRIIIRARKWLLISRPGESQRRPSQNDKMLFMESVFAFQCYFFSPNEVEIRIENPLAGFL